MQHDRSRLIVLVGLLGAWNVVINVVAPPPTYVPANLAMAGLLLVLARRWGIGAEGLGLQRATRARGLRLGLAAAAVVALGIGILATVGWTRRFFEDGSLVELGAVGMMYQVIIRIPLGTALLEEVAFRGLLFGVWAQRSSSAGAAFGSSVFFALWHVLPTLGRLELNPAGGYAVNGLAEVAIVGGAVVATFFAGLGFVWLRMRSGSLVAPVVTHALINSTAFIVGWVVAG